MTLNELAIGGDVALPGPLDEFLVLQWTALHRFALHTPLRLARFPRARPVEVGNPHYDDAAASEFDRLEVLGHVVVEAEVADDLLIGRSLVLALAPERAELTGEKAAVMQQLIGGRRSRLIRSDTAEARRKRHQRSPEGDTKVHWSGREAWSLPGPTPRIVLPEWIWGALRGVA